MDLDVLEETQRVYLRRTNIAKVMELLGYSREDLETILDRAEERGMTIVTLPLVPKEIRAALASNPE